MGEEMLRKGPWYDEEDERLRAFVAILGARRWDSVARISGLRRSGKSCRLRWLNYLRPCLKHGAMTPQEEQIILKLHDKWGNKWAKISRRLPGRTDNEVKNFWRTYLRKKEQIQNSLLLHQSISSTSNNNVSSSKTSSSSDHTNKEGENAITSTKISSNIIINNTNDEIATNDINIGAIMMGDYDNYNVNYQKGQSDYVITNSPYENRLTDWINMLPEEQNEDVEEFCVDDPMTWCYGDGINAWDFSDIKWDMDLFNNINQ